MLGLCQVKLVKESIVKGINLIDISEVINKLCYMFLFLFCTFSPETNTPTCMPVLG